MLRTWRQSSRTRELSLDQGSQASKSLSPDRALLERVLAYENDEVISRFSEDYSVSVSDAREIFLETKRWLWLCAKRNQDIKEGKAKPLAIPLFNEAYAIDLMWHTFILHTENYADFCQTYFGTFVHHHPRPSADRKAWQEKIGADPKAAQKERVDSLRKVYGYLFDELGPQILVKWCEEFPARFKFH